jgi:hypothetical protein
MDEIVGKIFKTKSEDSLLVLEQLPKEKGKSVIFRCQFQKYPCIIFSRKKEILSGSIINPLQEQKEFIEKIWPQHCGDSLRIIKKSENKVGYFLCEFIKYPYQKEFLKNCIKIGECNNPRIEEEEFLKKEWPQNCGDILRIIKKERGVFLCEFIKYPYLVNCRNKSQILKGGIINPLVEKYEFIDKLWPQNCGDSLKIIKKIPSQIKGESCSWECEFLKYPCRVILKKEAILRGYCNNPQIDIVEFLQKEWPQNCGDSVRVEESNKFKLRNDGRKSKLYKYTFLKYPYVGYETKTNIKAGILNNPNFPYKSKAGILNIIKTKFTKKPTLRELAKELDISVVYTGQQIQKFNLKEYIEYCPTESLFEKELRDYCCVIDKSFLKESTWDFLNGQEIDIYSPKMKLGIEFNGNYWHSELFKERNYHQEKSLLAQEKGIQLIHIWEWEWNQRNNILQSLIKSKLGIFNKIVYARKCQIKEISTQEYNNFCENFHLQGICGAKVKLGLFYKDELVQIMSFGCPRFTNNFKWEILRECSRLGYCVVGGKQRLWSYFVKNYNPENCISYCDFSKFRGDSYLKLGFKKERLNKPGFVWWENNTNNVYWRNPFENQKMKEKGYYKIWDCGQLVFTWYN